jgi:hypothetical protein
MVRCVRVSSGMVWNREAASVALLFLLAILIDLRYSEFHADKDQSDDNQKDREAGHLGNRARGVGLLNLQSDLKSTALPSEVGFFIGL